jgi:transposase-like protein
MGLCKKKKSISDEAFEKEYGRHWIWGSIDPESKLIINFFIGQRTLRDCRIFIDDLISRVRTNPLFTSDELPHYETVLRERFSHLEEQPRTGRPGRPKRPKVVMDPELKYATVHKTQVNGKVTKVERKVIF